MSKPDTTIDPRILDSAKKEFLENGFEKASLQTICKNAEVTTGALYKRYKGKEALFCSVVEPTIEGIYAMIRQRTLSQKELQKISDQELIDAWSMKKEVIMYYFKVFYQYRDGFLLLLKHAAGTKHEDFAHELVEGMSVSTIMYYREGHKRGLFQREISDEEFHVLLSAFWSAVYEPFIHGMSWEQLEHHAELLCCYFDWIHVLDIRGK
ncbi:MAG: TetR/AcrR family transcriptional regulator [Lachnospiraceae bacterium]|nr:TetR/AcrR family transcriptional regulator [Lachnospiraceae bacterium]